MPRAIRALNKRNLVATSPLMLLRTRAAGGSKEFQNMCDYSLKNVMSRPAKVGDKLTTRQFPAGTRGFAAPENHAVAVCLVPGTELAFAREVAMPAGLLGWRPRTMEYRTAVFRQINRDLPHTHHDALEFPDGQVVLLTNLLEGQVATVLQLPARPANEAEAAQQKRAAYIG